MAVNIEHEDTELGQMEGQEAIVQAAVTGSAVEVGP